MVFSFIACSASSNLFLTSGLSTTFLPFVNIVLEPVKNKWIIIRNRNEQTEIPDEYKDLDYPNDPHYV